jgi:hypothetical protein
MELVNLNAFSSCREYVRESVLRFDHPENSQRLGPRGSATPASNVSSIGLPAEIPLGLPFECRIVTTIDSETAAVGDPIEALLRSPLTDANGKVLVPPGAHIHGRLTRFVEHPGRSAQTTFYEIGVQLRSLELNGVRLPFGASIVNATPKKGDRIRFNPNSGGGTFVFYEKKVHLTGLDARWITALPEPHPGVHSRPCGRNGVFL